MFIVYVFHSLRIRKVCLYPYRILHLSLCYVNMTLLVNNCLFHKEDTVMNSAFFARAAQGAISKLGSEGKVLSGNSGGDKNGGHSIDECDPAIKQSRDIASKRIFYFICFSWNYVVYL